MTLLPQTTQIPGARVSRFRPRHSVRSRTTLAVPMPAALPAGEKIRHARQTTQNGMGCKRNPSMLISVPCRCVIYGRVTPGKYSQRAK